MCARPYGFWRTRAEALDGIAIMPIPIVAAAANIVNVFIIFISFVSRLDNA
jgi:hypothetical protein